MNRKSIKICVTIVMAIICIAIAISPVFATISPGTVKGTSDVGDAKIGEIGNKIVSIIKNIAIVVSVSVILVLGIKYMMGSAEEKADYKKTMIPYFIGAVMVFAGANIVTAIQAIAEKL